jgi:hypothetical protein
MKKLFVVTGFLFLCGYAIGQAKDGTADLQSTASSQPAASIYLPYSPEVVKKALNNYLSQTSDREQKNAKGYLLSSNTLIVKNNKSDADMHFVIGLKDPTTINESVVYLKLNSPSSYEQSVQRFISLNLTFQVIQPGTMMRSTLCTVKKTGDLPCYRMLMTYVR